jgi:hypothetical protein
MDFDDQFLLTRLVCQNILPMINAGNLRHSSSARLRPGRRDHEVGLSFAD